MAYVYRHIRLDKNEPFYIGIGEGYRADAKNGRNNHWKNISNKTEYIAEIIMDGLSWDDACEKEKEFIKLYGRNDLGLGTLCNMTDGGEGAYGRILSDETKRKISESNKGKIIPREIVEKIRQKQIGKKHSDETKEKMSKASFGIKKSEQHRKSIAKANKDKDCSKMIECARIANIGKKHTKETIEKRIKNRKKNYHTEDSKKKMSESIVKSGRTVKVLCLNNGIVYESISMASRLLKVNNIHKVLNNEISATKGYKFVIVMEAEIKELKAKLAN